MSVVKSNLKIPRLTLITPSHFRYVYFDIFFGYNAITQLLFHSFFSKYSCSRSFHVSCRKYFGNSLSLCQIRIINLVERFNSSNWVTNHFDGMRPLPWKRRNKSPVIICFSGYCCQLPCYQLINQWTLKSIDKFKAFIGIPEMQNSKLSPTMIESCPNPIIPLYLSLFDFSSAIFRYISRYLYSLVMLKFYYFHSMKWTDLQVRCWDRSTHFRHIRY